MRVGGGGGRGSFSQDLVRKCGSWSAICSFGVQGKKSVHGTFCYNFSVVDGQGCHTLCDTLTLSVTLCTFRGWSEITAGAFETVFPFQSPKTTL